MAEALTRDDYTRIHSNRARTYLALELHGTARQDAEEAMRRDRTYLPAHLVKGKAHLSVQPTPLRVGRECNRNLALASLVSSALHFLFAFAVGRRLGSGSLPPRFMGTTLLAPTNDI